MSDWFASENIFVANLNNNKFVKFSKFLHGDIHYLKLPVRVFASVDAYSRSPSLFSNLNSDEGIHFVEKTRLSVMSQVCRLNVNSNMPFRWNNEGSSNTDCRCRDNNFRLLNDWWLNDNLWSCDWWLHNYLRSLNTNSRVHQSWHLNRGSCNNNLGLLDLRGCDDYLRCHVSMSVEELRSEMDATSWVTVELNLNPFFSWS